MHGELGTFSEGSFLSESATSKVARDALVIDDVHGLKASLGPLSESLPAPWLKPVVSKIAEKEPSPDSIGEPIKLKAANALDDLFSLTAQSATTPFSSLIFPGSINKPADSSNIAPAKSSVLETLPSFLAPIISSPPVQETPVAPQPAPSPPAQWLYRDPAGSVQGPFTGAEMTDWFHDNYFDGSLPVRRTTDQAFIALSIILALSPEHRSAPFTSPIPSSLFTPSPVPAPVQPLLAAARDPLGAWSANFVKDPLSNQPLQVRPIGPQGSQQPIHHPPQPAQAPQVLEPFLQPVPQQQFLGQPFAGPQHDPSPVITQVKERLNMNIEQQKQIQGFLYNVCLFIVDFRIFLHTLAFNFSSKPHDCWSASVCIDAAS